MTADTGPWAPATLLAAYLARVDWAQVAVLTTPRYAPDYLSATIADQMPWDRFRDIAPTIAQTLVAGTALEALLVPKTVTWSDRDINIFVGAPATPGAVPLRSMLDLSAAAFVAVFGWHIVVARRVSAALGRDVYVTHGFNPTDTAPDAHSVAAKFHTHIHVPDLAHRRPVRPAELTHFERLALIEPCASIATDLVRHCLATCSSTDTSVVGRWTVTGGFGHVSITTPLDGRLGEDLCCLHTALAVLHDHYRELVEVFTDGQLEQATGHLRFVPVAPAERLRRLTAFEAISTVGWSAESLAVLRHLAGRLVPATARDTPRSTCIASAAQAWLAKGMSGALNLVVPADGSALRIDFAPRVISTSGATKVVSVGPTLIRKAQGVATAGQRQRLRDFEQLVVAATSGTPDIPLQGRSPSSATSSSPARPASSA
ncbi:hypothetical protein AB0M46_26890 [Dactylosporangium sp. NPDC051485]|uniref:hypothetical protein n=1 Tax=Dactylosporangium sp. NPDC051485 TaxID=3154846 RepID=UPI00343D74F3